MTQASLKRWSSVSQPSVGAGVSNVTVHFASSIRNLVKVGPRSRSASRYWGKMDLFFPRMVSRSLPSSSIAMSVPGLMTCGWSVSIAFCSPTGVLGGDALAAGLAAFCWAGGDSGASCLSLACTTRGLGVCATSSVFLCGALGVDDRTGSALLSATKAAMT